MGIFDRLNTVIKSNLNSMLDRAEDPEKLIVQTVHDMQGELKQAKRELVSALGTAKRLGKEVEEHEAKAAEWEDKALLALKAGDEDLAREALRRKQKSLKEAERVRSQVMNAEGNAANMKDMIERVEHKIDDLKARKGTLASDVRRAREAPSESAGGGGRFGSKTFDELDRMTHRIDQLEAEAEVGDILDDGRADVDAKFAALEKQSEGGVVEDELASLKAKLDG